MNHKFWTGRRVLLTGHTGFKGAWTAVVLERLGATGHGFALAPDEDPALWSLIGDRTALTSHIGDLRDVAALDRAIAAAKPQVVLHMAAQAQVRRSYQKPIETFATNVLGTANLLEALRAAPGVEVVLVITTDKVYRNDEEGRAYGESAPLGGDDPYSASKAACEIVVESFRRSFFDPRDVVVASARAGNVLGGGDFAADRLVPDVYRAIRARRPLQLRYPQARRPWQHVMDCVTGYLMFVEYLHAHGLSSQRALNFGPPSEGMTVAEVVDAMRAAFDEPIAYEVRTDESMPEKAALALDPTAARDLIGWTPRLSFAQTIEWTANWYAAFARGDDALNLVLADADRYFGLTGR